MRRESAWELIPREPLVAGASLQMPLPEVFLHAEGCQEGRYAREGEH